MYDQALYINPYFVNAYLNKGSKFNDFKIGVALDLLNLYEEAIQMYEKAIEIEPSNVLAYLNKGKNIKSIIKD